MALGYKNESMIALGIKCITWNIAHWNIPLGTLQNALG